MDFNIELIQEIYGISTSTREFTFGANTARWKARRTLRPRLIAVVAVGLALVTGLVSCDGGASGKAAEQTVNLETVRGMVLEVDAESLISLAALEVQDEKGVVWRFEGRGKVVPGFTPSHLNEHKLLGQSVEVTFYREGEALVLHDITD